MTAPKVLVACVAVLCFAVTAPAISSAPLLDPIYGAPVIIPEPAFTRGETNTIRWEKWPANGWDEDGATGEPSDRRRFIVSVKDLATGAEKTFVVPGADSTSLTITRDEFPGGAALDGKTYEFRVRRSQRLCTSGEVILNTCQGHSTIASRQSSPTSSTQDARPPTGTFTIENGAQFTNRLAVNVQLAATDPGSRASGVGFVQFSPDASFACPVQALTCASPYASQMEVPLAPGPDGPRTVSARFYDRARRPAGSATPSAFERNPSGNVSAATSDTILLDTTGPMLSVTRSAEPAMMNVPVSFNASGSRDQGGFGSDSGLDAATAVWDFGDGTNGSGLAITHTYTRAGAFTASLSIRDRVGNESRLAFTVNVSPTAPGGGTTTTGTPTPTPPPQADTTAPALSGVRLVRRARIVFSLSEAATVFLEIRRLRPRPTIALFKVMRAGTAGANVVPLTAKMRRRLARAGRYHVLLAARDAAGNASRVSRITIRRTRR
jgi:hypothetical protein